MHPTHTRPNTAEPTPADILRCAALYLHRHGWHRGDMFADPTQPTPAACAQGAIRMAVCGSPTIAYTVETARQVHTAVREFGAWLAWTYLDDYFAEFKALYHGDETVLAEVIGDWNDETGRTAAEIILALQQAADAWDSHHRARHPGGAR